MITEAIFVVDDSDDYRFLLQQIFARFLPAYRVHFFTSGSELCDYMMAQIDGPLPLKTPPQLILMDLNMPGFSGQQTLSFVKKSVWQAVPVVMITNEGSEQERAACYKAGANSFLTKPIGLEATKDMLTQLCHYWVDLNQT
ncbi:response regulator [Fibrella sp. HMF5335]|uniref:Response regulator n=1 Tax=Fibrella rubiginis TaxID=2817060 RepID=A0A939GKP3_9BACT|nr:response regulator [Fibrella rubiginis]MBO0939185.1 response regulator [Fibrella rubiginis]